MNELQIVSAFKTIDGQLFESEDAAKAHEIERLCTVELDKFSSLYVDIFSQGSRTVRVMREAVVAWEQFKAGVPPTMPKKTCVKTSGLTIRTMNCLLAENILFVEDAQAMNDLDLMKVPNLGRLSVAEIRGWSKS